VIEIANISERPGATDSLVSWNFDYWSERTPEVNLTDWENFYQLCLESRQFEIPQTLVGFEDGHLFGGVTIVNIDDIKKFPNYGPWIAALIVEENFRGRNLGLALMNAALEKIQAMGCQEVFLWTDSRDKWYSRQGWNEIHRLPFGLVKAVVMKKIVEKNIGSLK